MQAAIDPLVIAQMALGAAGDIAFAMLVGALLLGFPAPSQRTTATIAAAGWLIAQLCYLPLQAGTMTGSWNADTFRAIPLVLTHSHFGMMWIVGIAAGAAAWLAAAVRPLRARLHAARTALLGAAVVAVAFAHAGTTHAADAGDFSIPELVHTVHLLATAGWAGTVIAAALPLRRLFAPAHSDAVANTLRLSKVATVTFAVAIAAGAFDAYRGLGGSLAPLTTSLWGELLAAKLAAVIGAVAIG
ncbi:MAG TPA: hypothetical protein VGL08_07245, partial [Paraburkholderia sp.]